MSRLPVIVSFGGYSAAGRSSFHQAYQRTVIDALPEAEQQETILGLAVMMGKVSYADGSYHDVGGEVLSVAEVAKRYRQEVFDGTLVRKIGSAHFDVDAIPTHQKLSLSQVSGHGVTFELSKRQLPQSVPVEWQVTEVNSTTVSVTIQTVSSNQANPAQSDRPDPNILLETSYRSAVQAAGQLPDGFDPASLYPSRFHPRGLQMSVIGASDAVNAMGVNWETIVDRLPPDQIAVYSTSAMSQLDQNSNAGLLQSRLKGERVSTKQLAFGFSSMPTDFINAYVLGSMGATGSVAGACASFLYNLQMGMEDIRSGRRRVVMVGSSEAPITPEIIDGYSTMSALATDEKLRRLDGVESPDYRRASRPFGNNCGFTLAESTQQVILMDDELALELGATIHGAVLDVFTNADGYKKSISSPGPGNYLTLAKAVASATNLLGEKAIAERSFVQAHGSSTPQNRITESTILNRVANAFGIKQWPVAAVKSYVGHSLAPASGDQLISSLGVFVHGVIPGIKTLDKVADDVAQEYLDILQDDKRCDEMPEVAFLNSKGFGGNNATASILSPQRTLLMLEKRYGQQAIASYREKNAAVKETAHHYHLSALQGNYCVRYGFGKNMVDENEIELTNKRISVPGCGQPIDLSNENLYKDMVDI
ncbi:MAG: acetoacetyl-[acyl-carrier protein] synthase [Candidatus Endobugula sp.]|jgi:acetoacetyl-[acyl-carrier protein] synthase